MPRVSKAQTAVEERVAKEAEGRTVELDLTAERYPGAYASRYGRHVLERCASKGLSPAEYVRGRMFPEEAARLAWVALTQGCATCRGQGDCRQAAGGRACPDWRGDDSPFFRDSPEVPEGMMWRAKMSD